MSKQPDWKFIGNIGDVNPITYGGAFIYEDRTGVYAPEVAYIDTDNSDELEKGTWRVYRFSIEPCTFDNAILSDNRFHPEHPAWFAQPESRRGERPQDTTYLSNISDFVGITPVELIAMFLSPDLRVRAQAWLHVGEYHGFENLDTDYETFNYREVKRHFAKERSILRRRKHHR